MPSARRKVCVTLNSTDPADLNLGLPLTWTRVTPMTMVELVFTVEQCNGEKNKSPAAVCIRNLKVEVSE